MLTQLSANYKTTKSYTRGIERVNKKHLAHAQNAISNFMHIHTKKSLKRKSSSRRVLKQVVPMCTLEPDEPTQPAQPTEYLSPASALELESMSDNSDTSEPHHVIHEAAGAAAVVPMVSFGPKHHAHHKHRKHHTHKKHHAHHGHKKHHVHPSKEAQTQPTKLQADPVELQRVKDLHKEAQRLRQKNAARIIQRRFHSKIHSIRYPLYYDYHNLLIIIKYRTHRCFCKNSQCNITLVQLTLTAFSHRSPQRSSCIACVAR